MTARRSDRAHLRIAHRLYEAVIDAPEMTDVQRLIVLALIRLTYGWQQRTVTISVTDLAKRVGRHTKGKSSGGFRAALHELVKNGVVLVIEPGDGARATTFALEEDFTHWGKFSTSIDRLATIWDERPPHADHLLGDRKGASTEALVGASPQAPPSSEGASPEAGRVPPQRQGGCPDKGTPTGSKSDTLRTCDPGKKGKQGKKEIHPPDGGSATERASEKPPDKPPGKPTWVTPYADAWRAQYSGELPIKPSVHALAAVRQKLGDEAALAAWRRYLAATPGAYANAPRFASTIGEWAEGPTLNGAQSQDAVKRLWRAMQRTDVLYTKTPAQWTAAVDAMVRSGELASDREFAALWDLLDVDFLKTAYSDRQAIEHLGDRWAELHQTTP